MGMKATPHETATAATTTVSSLVIDSPLGPIRLTGDDQHLMGIDFVDRSDTPPSAIGAAPVLTEAARQLDAYFAGKLKRFNLPTLAIGSGFQMAVWKSLGRIGFATTTTYGAVARSIGRPNASRAVGGAIGANPIPIVIPCHRVIGSNGSLTGYSSGLERKKILLSHEQAVR